MKYSIQIPNYNYEKYIGLTIESCLSQTYDNIEIVICDNASTDRSLDIIKQYADMHENIKWKKNPVNVGFGPNLERTAQLSSGNWRLMLSSDDLLEKDFILNIDKVIQHEKNNNIVISTIQTVIDEKNKIVNKHNVDSKYWRKEDIDEKLSKLLGCNVYKVNSKELLKRSLKILRTPFTFASTTYYKETYYKTGGYYSPSIINPDKKFAYQLLRHSEYSILVDLPLVKYRIHSNNQVAQQSKSGALKHLVDQYMLTFMLSDDLLDYVGLSRDELSKAFILEDVILRGIDEFSKGNRKLSTRMINFGKATYPNYIYRNKYYYLYLIIKYSIIGARIVNRYKIKMINKIHKIN